MVISTFRTLAIGLSASFALLLATACGGSGSSGTKGNGGDATSTIGGGGSGNGTTISSSSSTGSGGDSTGCTPSDCSDDFPCTIDACNADTCTHTIGPNEGPTACPPGQYCTVQTGCIAAPACATTQDCEDAWAGDACKSHIACDPASSICIFDLLDKDGDGHPPPVCGGDDCDDNDSARFPGNVDVCDGKDNDCDGTVDDGATCPNQLDSCQAGVCSCAPQNHCSGQSCQIFDFQSDEANCGGCNTQCPPSSSCLGGNCVCSAPLTFCGSSCVNTANDPLHCGACNTQCAVGASCNGGVCTLCPPPTTNCGGVCVDLNWDGYNCGACGATCFDGEECTWGSCMCVGVGCGTGGSSP